MAGSPLIVAGVGILLSIDVGLWRGTRGGRVRPVRRSWRRTVHSRLLRVRRRDWLSMCGRRVLRSSRRGAARVVGLASGIVGLATRLICALVLSLPLGVLVPVLAPEATKFAGSRPTRCKAPEHGPCTTHTTASLDGTEYNESKDS